MSNTEAIMRHIYQFVGLGRRVCAIPVAAQRTAGKMSWRGVEGVLDARRTQCSRTSRRQFQGLETAREGPLHLQHSLKHQWSNSHIRSLTAHQHLWSSKHDVATACNSSRSYVSRIGAARDPKMTCTCVVPRPYPLSTPVHLETPEAVQGTVPRA